MRTTVRLDETLLKRAKRAAARRNITLTALLEEGLQLALARSSPPPRQQRVSLPVSKETGGTLPGIDLDDSTTVIDVMEVRR